MKNKVIFVDDRLGLKGFKCNKENLGRHKDLHISIVLKTFLSEYDIVDTDDAFFKTHIVEALKEKSQERVEQYLRNQYRLYRKFKEILEKVNDSFKKMRGGINPKIFGEMLNTGGGIIHYFSVNISAYFCCCQGNKYKFKKSYSAQNTKEYNVNLREITEKSWKKLKSFPDDLARASAQAVEELKSKKCL